MGTSRRKTDEGIVVLAKAVDCDFHSKIKAADSRESAASFNVHSKIWNPEIYLAVISTEASVCSHLMCMVHPLPDLSYEIVKFSSGASSFVTFISNRASSSLSY